MKALVTTLTFAAFALGATAAQASLQTESLSATDRNAVRQLVPNADLRNLSSGQIRDLRTFVAASDYMRQPGGEAYVRNILNRG